MMWTAPSVICLLLVAGHLLASSDAAGNDLAKANSGFGFRLYKKIAEQEDAENIFFSPYSISTALAMTYVGSRGNTQAELQTALGFSGLDEDSVKTSYKQLIEGMFATNDDYVLKSANKLYSQEGWAFESDFKADLAEFFKASSQEVDFAKDTEASRELINQWVYEQTDNTIKDLFPSGTIKPVTIMVLVNALYFKSDWFFKFDSKDTKTENFNVLGGSTVSVPMMQLQTELKYKENDKFAALEIPYKGDDLAMYIILPDKTSDLKEVEGMLDGDELDTLIGGMFSSEVKLALPKFKVTQKMQLPDILKALGIQDLFSANMTKADLSGISKASNLSVSDVVHQAYISIDEEGTEASAATGVVLVSFSLPISKVFRVDRPFIFFIRDKTTGSNLFMGRVVNPDTATEPLKLRMMRSAGGGVPAGGATVHATIPTLVAMALVAMVTMWFGRRCVVPTKACP